jgi:ceramide glucosyltransferase
VHSVGIEPFASCKKNPLWRVLFATWTDRAVNEHWSMALDFDVQILLQLPIYLGMVVAAVCYGLQLFAAQRFFRPQSPTAGFHPTVTVLKPLKGAAAELYENLRSLCMQEYPTFQVLCGVAEADDPAAAVVRRLQEEFPHLDLELVVDGRQYGANRKVSNLHNMYQRAKHEVIVLADCDVRVGRQYLTNIVAPLRDPHTGASTCLYRATSTGGGPSLIEALCVNTDFAPLVLLARLVERTAYAFGATIALRRSALDEIGGFLPIANFLGDDCEIGRRIAARGYVNQLNDELIETVLAVGSWRRLWEHQLRWARTYRIIRPLGYFGSILTHGTFFALLNLLANGVTPFSCASSVALIGLRYAVAARMAWTHLGTNLTGAELLLVGPKDLFLTTVWFAAFAGNTVVWGDHRFAVQRNGEMTELGVQPSAALAAPVMSDE